MGGSPSNTVQKTDPWAGQQPYLLQGFKQAQKLYNQGPSQYYPGQTVAGFTPAQQTGQQTALDYANTALPAYAQHAMQANQGMFNAADVAHNPYVQSYAQAATQPIIDNFMQQVLPNIRNDAVASGQYGGSRQGVAEGLATNSAQQNVLNTSAQIYNDAYGKGLTAQLGSIAQAPGIAAMGLQPSQIQSQVGAQQQAQHQAELDAAKAKYDYNQMAPWQNLQNYNAGIGMGSNFGGTVTKEGGQSPGTLLNAIGGAATGAGLATTLYPTFAAAGPVGWGLVGLGTLAGLMS